MEIGKIYEFKKYFFYLYQVDIELITRGIFNCGPSIFESPKHMTASIMFGSKEFNCKVSHVSPNSLVMCLEKYSVKDKYDTVFYKVLTSEGEVGWVIIYKWGIEYWIEQCGQGAVT